MFIVYRNQDLKGAFLVIRYLCRSNGNVEFQKFEVLNSKDMMNNTVVRK